MRMRTLASLLRGGRLGLLRTFGTLSESVYRATFVAACSSCGLLARLAAGPVPFDRLCAELNADGDLRDGLAVWLQVGVRVGELALGPDGYRLRGRLARQLADPANDDLAAALEEIVTLHHGLLQHTPERLRARRPYSMADQDGEKIARSSRVLEPFVQEGIDAVVPASGPVRLLEVGCGSGTHIRYAAARNPGLTAVGLELQPQVADAARANLCAWGLSDRVTVEAVDVRARAPGAGPAFDVATLHNNIYYFRVAERVDLLRHLRGFLAPGGSLLITTGTPGGSAAMELVNLWSAMTAGCGRYPEPAEMCEQLRAAGFGATRAVNVTPLIDRFYYFVGVNAAG